MFDDYSLWGLFISAFISSTLAPGGSEVVLLWLANNSQHSHELLLAIASLGNTLGGVSSFLLGYLFYRLTSQRVNTDKHQQAIKRIQKWGSPVLLFSWVPIVGDPICLAAGWLRMAWLPAILFIAIGKTLRYQLLLTVGG